MGLEKQFLKDYPHPFHPIALQHRPKLDRSLRDQFNELVCLSVRFPSRCSGANGMNLIGIESSFPDDKSNPSGHVRTEFVNDYLYCLRDLLSRALRFATRDSLKEAISSGENRLVASNIVTK